LNVSAGVDYSVHNDLDRRGDQSMITVSIERGSAGVVSAAAEAAV